MRNGAQLIAYADRLGGRGITGIGEVLDGALSDAFTGVHVLPFYTPFDGADAGFDPADHTAVDPRLGSWDDVQRVRQGPDRAGDPRAIPADECRDALEAALRGAFEAADSDA